MPRPVRRRSLLITLLVAALAAVAAAAVASTRDGLVTDPEVTITFVGGWSESDVATAPAGAPHAVAHLRARWRVEVLSQGRPLRLSDLRRGFERGLGQELAVQGLQGRLDVHDPRSGETCSEPLRRGRTNLLGYRGRDRHLVVQLSVTSLTAGFPCTGQPYVDPRVDGQGHLVGHASWAPLIPDIPAPAVHGPAGLAEQRYQSAWFAIDVDDPAETVPVRYSYAADGVGPTRRQLRVHWWGTVTVALQPG